MGLLWGKGTICKRRFPNKDIHKKWLNGGFGLEGMLITGFIFLVDLWCGPETAFPT